LINSLLSLVGLKSEDRISFDLWRTAQRTGPHVFASAITCAGIKVAANLILQLIFVSIVLVFSCNNQY